jgi:hypothetical protein
MIGMMLPEDDMCKFFVTSQIPKIYAQRKNSNELVILVTAVDSCLPE